MNKEILGWGYGLSSYWRMPDWPYATSFIGAVAAQRFDDFELWEEFFGSFPLKTFIELGTGRGGTSLLFLMHCIQWGTEFYTVDIVESEAESSPLGLKLGLSDHCIRGDILNDTEARRKIVDIIEREEGHPLLVYCDNGNKPEEFRFFSPIIREGDFIVVHDWNAEITEWDISLMGFETIFEEKCYERKSITRWFQKCF
jgi:cephalosporin hydroxylase